MPHAIIIRIIFTINHAISSGARNTKAHFLGCKGRKRYPENARGLVATQQAVHNRTNNPLPGNTRTFAVTAHSLSMSKP
eukprot:8147794-Pyramimonas_sp.AAC.1